MGNKILSYGLGFLLAVCIVLPPTGYTVPFMEDPVLWTCLALIAAVAGMLMLRTNLIPIQLKVLSVYLFFVSFLSQGPHSSFNGYVTLVGSLILFILFTKVENWGPILDMIEAAFWVEVVLAFFQLIGWDRLLNFDKLHSRQFLGTVMQYMRFSSALAIMSPFLIWRNWKYVSLLATLAFVSESSSFAFSLISCVGSFLFMNQATNRQRLLIVCLGLTLAVGYAIYDWGSFEGAVVASNGGRLVSWEAVIRTWIFDTVHVVAGQELIGPVMWKWVFLGHGLDTFMYLFPVYKHDPNPFGQAHNSWLQFGWEMGLCGLSIVLWWVLDMAIRLYREREFGLVSGIILVSTNMMFCFPERMTQTAPLMVAYCALCWTVARQYQRIRERNLRGMAASIFG